MRATLMTMVMVLAALPAWAGDIRPLGRGDWAKLTAQHAKRPTVVHFWSLTCAPCLAELPAWAEFARKRPDIDLVLVATDPVAQSARLSAMAARAGLAGIEQWAFDGSLPERLRFEIDPEWMGELPHTARLERGVAAFRTGSLIEDGIGDWLSGEEGQDHVHRAHH